MWVPLLDTQKKFTSADFHKEQHLDFHAMRLVNKVAFAQIVSVQAHLHYLPPLARGE